MVIYSSAPRASIDGAWESRFDTVRPYSHSESVVCDPSGIFTCRSFLYRSIRTVKPIDDPSSPFSISLHEGHGSFRVSLRHSRNLASSVFQDSSRILRKNVSTKFEISVRGNVKRTNSTMNIILEKSFEQSFII